MLPEYLYTAVSTSMQDIVRDDFNLLNGAHNVANKDLCSSLSSDFTSVNGLSKHSDCINPYDLTTLNSIKLEENNSVDLFPTHPNTWQQHPLNSHEHAHLRLNPSQTNKLLLQGSDDPLISHGANNVGTIDDDHPNVEFKTLIAAAAAEGRQYHTSNDSSANHLDTNSSYMRLKSLGSGLSSCPSTVTLGTSDGFNSPTAKKVQNGCSLLTKQQLKVKAGLMSAQIQQQKQQQQQQLQMQQQQQQLQKQISQLSQQQQNHNQNQNPKNVSDSGNLEAKQPKTPKTKKKGSLKLRFHHQALPLEYLNHYEASQGNYRGANEKTTISVPTSASASVSVSSSGTSSLRSKSNQTMNANKASTSKGSHENVRSWLQKIAEIQRTAEKQQQQQQKMKHHKEKQDDNNNNTSVIASRVSLLPDGAANSASGSGMPKREFTVQEPTRKKIQQAVLNNVNQKRVANYSDLPFMGEITLNISKPRRGRKPKKADICHLIYKNYGTVLAGGPQQNLPGSSPAQISDPNCLDLKLNSNEQPLNLCLRDQTSDLYSISSGEEDDIPVSANSSNCPTPPTNPADALADNLLSANLKQSMKTSPVNGKESDLKPAKDNKVNSGLHPVGAYYQKLLESGNFFPQGGQFFGLPIETIEKDNQLALKIPIPNDFLNNMKLDYPETLSTPSSVQSDNSAQINSTNLNFPQHQSLANSQNTQQQVQHPVVSTQKRKRSAIFIPPIPAENTTNPATEVSICKFKFTGGAKPSLQEKKMLSVDAGGNYRYFSGTGDKSTRGYEFFPRECLQQTGLIPGVNCTGTFFSTSGEKVFVDIPPPSAGLSHDVLQLPESPQALLPLLPPRTTTPLRPCSSSPASPYPSSPIPQIHSISPSLYSSASNPNPAINETFLTEQSQQRCSSTVSASQARPLMADRSKKKTRRSSQREKLEKTFKEKGFLIQTQQLESAEGATYCKFRQLKKFTRYLFRNWKDYLPDTNDMAKHMHTIKIDEKPDHEEVEDEPETSIKDDNFLNGPHTFPIQEPTDFDNNESASIAQSSS